MFWTVIAQGHARNESSLGLTLLVTAYLAGIGYYCYRVWSRYGRLPLAERIRNRGKFKSEIFLRYPVLYLIGLAWTIGSIVFLWYLTLGL